MQFVSFSTAPWIPTILGSMDKGQAIKTQMMCSYVLLPHVNTHRHERYTVVEWMTFSTACRTAISSVPRLTGLNDVV